VGADATFLNNSLDVPRSAHYGIGKLGQVHQYVQEKDTAFHAGVIRNPTWSGLKLTGNGGFVNPNYYTIGIEHEGRPNDDWTPEMYAAGARLLGDISRRYPKLSSLTPANVVMHRQIRADKSCPGNKFDLARLLREVPAGSDPVLGEPDAVITTAAVNLRRPRPSTTASVVRLIPKDSMMHVVARVAGDTVSGNNQWYQTLDGDYFWAGATDKP
jgi:N-acetylmuramoyl-L-alanine amidase